MRPRELENCVTGVGSLNSRVSYKAINLPNMCGNSLSSHTHKHTVLLIPTHPKYSSSSPSQILYVIFIPKAKFVKYSLPIWQTSITDTKRHSYGKVFIRVAVLRLTVAFHIRFCITCCMEFQRMFRNEFDLCKT